MLLEEILKPNHLEYFKKLDPKKLKEITPERIVRIKDIANIYLNFHEYFIVHNSKEFVLNKILENTAEHNMLYYGLTEGFGLPNIVQFENETEVLLFIIYVIDPNYNIMNKYLSFVEETNSNAKALIMYKQYAKKYSSFFDPKILQGELILKDIEQELISINSSNKKRTITG